MWIWVSRNKYFPLLFSEIFVAHSTVQNSLKKSQTEWMRDWMFESNLYEFLMLHLRMVEVRIFRLSTCKSALEQHRFEMGGPICGVGKKKGPRFKRPTSIWRHSTMASPWRHRPWIAQDNLHDYKDNFSFIYILI